MSLPHDSNGLPAICLAGCRLFANEHSMAGVKFTFW